MSGSSAPVPPLSLTGGPAQSGSDAFADIANGGITLGPFYAGGSGKGVNTGAGTIASHVVIGLIVIVGAMLWVK